MVETALQFVQAHPIATGSVGVAVVLAIIGLWYVLAHHLQAILVTLLCAAGVGSGVDVLYRGWSTGLTDLIAIGAFLIVVFPVIFLQQLRSSRPAGTGAAAGQAKPSLAPVRAP